MLKSVPLLILALLSHPASALENYPDLATATAAATTPRSVATLEQLELWSTLLDASELGKLLLGLEQDLPPLEAEWVLFEWLRGQRQQLPTPAVRDAVRRLERYQPKTLIAHPDKPHHAIAAFPLPAAASGTRHQWQAEALKLAALRAIEQGDSSFWLDLHGQPEAADLAGLRGALTESATLPEATRSALIQLTQLQPVYAGVVVSAARYSGDPELLQTALAADPASRVRTLLELDQSWSLTDAEPVLRQWLQGDDPVAAAAALTALARHRGRIDGIDQLLFDKLSDPDLGAAAAQALAAISEPAVTSRLTAAQAQTDDPLLAARAELALRLRVADLPAGARR